jgi:peptide subunit release factor 1 (eRF1)
VYWCGRSFVVDPLFELYQNPKCTTGVVVTNGENTKLYLLDTQKTTYFLEDLDGKLPTGHRKGGQSAPRFQRMYLSALDAYNKKIIECCLRLFRKEGNPFVKKVIITGNGIRKKHLSDELSGYFSSVSTHSYSTVNELIENLDEGMLSRGDERKTAEYIRQLIERASELLVFGNEVFPLANELKMIISCSDTIEVAPEKLTVFHNSTEEYKWLQSFGGLIGIRYYAPPVLTETL